MNIYLSPRITRLSPLVLRVGVGAAILWFGLNEVLQPDAWTVWVPQWAQGHGLSVLDIVYLNGMFEIVASSLVMLGIYARMLSFLLCAHMLLIIIDIGLTAIGVRDCAIAVALFTIAINDADDFLLIG